MAPVGVQSGVDAIAEAAARASDVWARSALPATERDGDVLFGPVAGAPFAEGKIGRAHV